MSAKGVILVGGPQKGTRFRPLSLETPKPLFPIAGKAMIWHQVQALSQVPGLSDIVLIGVYEDSVFATFLKESKREFPNVNISYLREFRALGTAGGLYHFRDTILRGNPDQIFVLNADICSAFPLKEMRDFHLTHRGVGTIIGKKVPRGTETRFGCIVTDPSQPTLAVHYVEKPESYISSTINVGVYCFDRSVFDEIRQAMEEKARVAAEDPTSEADDIIHLERDVITRLASNRKLYVFETTDFFRQIKSAASALPANALYLCRYSKTNPSLLIQSSANIVGPVFIDPSASIHPSAKIGPNVSIGKGVVVNEGARVLESILLDNVVLEKSSVVKWSIVSSDCKIGAWGRIEGEPEDESGGEKQKKVTILGNDVHVSKEVHIRSCIVLPSKQIDKSCKNEVLL